MNFYKRFIGDIQAKTGGLSLAQFGAYDRLLDHYYSTEKPIPAEDCYRICRAMSKEERSSVDKVLASFFELGPDGYSQSKADEVIAKALPLIEAARANGKLGGRPKKPKTHKEPTGFSSDGVEGEKTPKKEGGKVDFPPLDSKIEKEASGNSDSQGINNLDDSSKPTGLFLETQQEPSAKAIQSQSQITTETSSVVKARKRAPARPEDVSEQVWSDWLELRKDKKAPVTVTVLSEARSEAQKAAMPLERFLSIWCVRGTQGLQADWLKPHERGALPRLPQRSFKDVDYTEGTTDGVPNA